MCRSLISTAPALLNLPILRLPSFMTTPWCSPSPSTRPANRAGTSLRTISGINTALARDGDGGDQNVAPASTGLLSTVVAPIAEECSLDPSGQLESPFYCGIVC